MSLTGRAVVVTGAGTGIGRATAEALLAAGASVTVVGRRKDLLDELAARGPVAVVAGDLTVPGVAEAVVEETVQRFGRLDGVVNNAGVARFAPLPEADLADFRTMLEINLWAPVALVRAAAGALREARGAVVNVSSVGGVLSMPDRSLYGATKAGLNSLTRSWARELAPDVRVNAVLPGPVDTPMYDDLGLGAARTATLRRDLIAATPMGRFGEPAELAWWICQLLDDDVAGWVSGALLPVDGGRTA